MHYHAEIYFYGIPEDIEDAVRRVLEGSEDSLSWDWWQIGGRWKGVHVEGYNPEEDESHKIKCPRCAGSGKRHGMRVRNLCDTCGGTGKETLWPTRWPMHPKDIIHVSKIPDDLTCAAIIIDGEVFFTKKHDTLKQFLEENGVVSGYLVTVDYHS